VVVEREMSPSKKKPASKKSPKRSAPKRPAAKRPAARKPAPKKPAPKKPAPKAAAKPAPKPIPRSIQPIPRPSRAPAARPAPLVGIVMGSRTDLDTLAAGTELLDALQIPYEMRILSAHRTPDETAAWAKGAEARGLEVIIAAAGGAAHLPGVIAAQTVLPVLGVPVDATSLNGLDALLSIVQMPKGVPVGTLAIGKPGAANAALLATAILALKRPELREKLRGWRAARVAEALAQN
jgi:5-(carboxyamino)imidazole ribonucleotide mutase